MCFLNHTDGPLFPPLLSPLPLATPPHHSDPTHPSSHHSPLSLLFTPLTSIHTNALPPLPHFSSPLPSLLPLATPHHPSPPLLTHPPHHTSSPPSSPLSSSPTFLTTHLFTTLFTPELVKSHVYMSLNLCRTFLSLKTSFLIIFCKKIFWDKIYQKLEYDGGGDAHVRNCARAMSSIHFSTCNILPLKKTLISHFRVLFVFN